MPMPVTATHLCETRRGEITQSERLVKAPMSRKPIGHSSLQDQLFGQRNAHHKVKFCGGHMHKVGSVAWAAFIWPLLSWAQTASPPGTRAQMVLTVGHYYGKDLPALTRDDVT